MKEEIIKEAVSQRPARAMEANAPAGKSRKGGEWMVRKAGKVATQVHVYSVDGHRVERVVSFLGGKEVIPREITSPMDTHHVISRGLPKRSVTHLLDSLVIVHDRTVLSGALGMSLRTQQRLKSEPEETLSVEASGKAWQFAETLAHASEVFGTQEAAERWLETPATALEGAKPINLLSTPPGSEMVRTLLTRIEFGVYT